jgi:N-acetylated-alpha-linked acidic dipeptidase
MRKTPRKILAPLVAVPLILSFSSGRSQTTSIATPTIFGFAESSKEAAWEQRFMAVPDPKIAKEDLGTLTQAPHMAGTPEDKITAEFVAKKFREAGLDTKIEEYRVWLDYPQEISVDITAPADVRMHGPASEHVSGDPYQDDPRIVMPFNAMSPSGDAEADVIYANYGTPEDFKMLESLKIDVRGKIVLVRYGQNFRGVKAFIAQQHGAAGLIIYSDPMDDGWQQGDKYPNGPWRPDTGVQRGSVGYIFEFPGDPTTPGIASVPGLPDSSRTPPEKSAALPLIPVIPLSYADATPILEHLGGPETPRSWQGALPFTYHMGPGPVRVRMHLKQDYRYRTIWDVTGTIAGTEFPGTWVVAGNHRDAWVYGAVDPASGTTAMLEAVRGVGELLKSGWKPKRTVVFASWDAEEFGLIGSTEWAEAHEAELANAAAYFNMDVGVSGPKFGASSVPSLKQFIRDIATAVPSPRGGTVYEAWQKTSEPGAGDFSRGNTTNGYRPPAAQAKPDVPVGDLGSGSDYTVFLQHLGIPSTDVGSTGSYGVYHSAFDNFQWFTKFADPDFVYEQQMARIFGLEVLRMADADIVPFDYEEYGKEVSAYLDAANKKAQIEFGEKTPSFRESALAAKHFEEAGSRMLARESKPANDAAAINKELTETERALLTPQGLPQRPWFRHAIYAPGEYTGYAAVVIPGINEAIDQHNLEETRRGLETLTSALNHATKILDRER